VADTTAAGTAGMFVPLTGRLLDTRNGTGGFTTPMPASTVRTVAAAGVLGIPSSGVSALALTLTAVGAASAGAVSVAPGDVASPTGTALVFNPGDSVSNTDLVALHADGTLHVVSNAAVNLIIDVQGYFTDGTTTAPGGFVAVDQTRIVDTRNGTNVAPAQVASGGAITVTAVGLGGVPSDASAVYVNIAVLGQTTNGYLRTYAAGAAVPTTGALGFDNTTQSESVAIPLSADGAFTVLVGAGGPVDLIIDIEGYFTAGQTSGSFTPAAMHLLDTRAAPVRTIAGNGLLTVPVAGIDGLPTVADGLAALALNLRTVQPSAGPNASGFLRVWPGDQPEPSTSSLNYTSSDVYRTDLAIVPPAADGTISIRNGGPDPIDVVIDAEGWFTASAPTAPTVTSSSFTDGQDGASPDANATFSFSAPPGVGNTAAVGYQYALDDADPTPITGASVTVPLGVSDPGAHFLSVTAIDANGIASVPTLFYFVIGADPSSSSDDGQVINERITTQTTETTPDGTTSTDSTSVTPAEPQQYGGDGGGQVARLSCSLPNHWQYLPPGYGVLANLRYQCKLPSPQVNWGIKLSPPPAATKINYVFESGFTWYRNGKQATHTAWHDYPIWFTFHGTFNPVPLNSHVYGTDNFTYTWWMGNTMCWTDVTVTLEFWAVP